MAVGKVMALAGAAAIGVALFRRHGGSRARWNPLAESSGAGGTGEDIRGAEEFSDPVDQAIDESFPASDPPSYAGHPRNSDET
jgi:hypothetical protein